jgi:hypothetical protein
MAAFKIAVTFRITGTKHVAEERIVPDLCDLGRVISEAAPGRWDFAYLNIQPVLDSALARQEAEREAERAA